MKRVLSITQKFYLLLLSGGSLVLEFKETIHNPSTGPACLSPTTMTRSATTNHLEEAILQLTQTIATLSTNHNELVTKVDTIFDHLTIQDSLQPPPSPPHNRNKPHLKLEVLRLDGDDAMGWIFKINQFFDYQENPEEERITLASFYMDGKALGWFQWMYCHGLITSWNGLLHALETRFAPSFYDDPRGALFKLTQRGSVNEYLTEFERLANRIVGLPPTFLLSCFISGLQPDIRYEVQALQPVSLSQVTALAKLQEDKLEDRRLGFKGKAVVSTAMIPYYPPLTPLPPPKDPLQTVIPYRNGSAS